MKEKKGNVQCMNMLRGKETQSNLIALTICKQSHNLRMHEALL